MSIPDKDTLKLYSYSAGLCNYCKASVIEQYFDALSNMGERAHVYGKRKGSARYIDQYSDNDTYDNLILLCAKHHKMIDDHPSQYSVQYLHSIKRDHENRIGNNPLIQANADVALILGIFQTYSMMYFYNIVDNFDPKYISLDIFEILDIENSLEENYQADYPFKNPELDRMTQFMFYSLRELLWYVRDQDIFETVLCGTKNYATFISKDLGHIHEVYKHSNNFKRAFKNWYMLCKTYGV